MDFARIDRIRKGGHVKRYHTHQCHHPGTVADHSWFVAWFSGEIWRAMHGEAAPSALYRYALEHDMSEFDTGDAPGWAKSAWKHLRGALDNIEYHRVTSLQLLRASPQIRAIVKAADQLDVLFWALEERRMGNTNATLIFVRTAAQTQSWLRKQDDKGLVDIVSQIRTDLIHQMCSFDWDHYHRICSQVEDGIDYYSRLGAEA